MKNKPILLTAAIGALVVWVGLVAQSRSIKFDDHLNYQEGIAKQLQHDLTANQHILETRYSLQASYDPLIEELQQVQTVQSYLAKTPDFLGKQESKKLQSILEDSHQTLARKVELSEQFKAQNALLKNSLSYLPFLINEIKQGSTNNESDRQIYQSLTEIFDQIAIYALSSDDELVPALQLQLETIQASLRQGTVNNRTDVSNALAHAKIIIDNKPRVDQLTQELLTLPTTQHIQDLSTAYDLAYESTAKRSSLFQLAATFWFVSMLGGTGYLLLLMNQSRKVKQLTSNLFESIDDAFVSVNQQWNITYINAQAAQILGKSIDDLLGLSIWQTFPQELGFQVKHYYQQAIDQQSVVTFEAEYIRHSCWLEFRLYPREDGLSVFWQDISLRKKSEFQLALSLEATDEALQKAETERVKADQALQKAEAERLKAQQANKSKSRFLANMSHELRTPLNAIIGYSEMLEEDAEDIGQDDFVPELQKIQGAGKHLLGLINDVLDLSKVEAGHMELYLETFDIKSLLQDVMSTIQPLVESNNNDLILQCPETIGTMHADQIKVRQSLFNLLSNASKFTQNGTITLQVRATQKDNHPWLDFHIQDTGIGMTSEQLGKIFNAFTQADSSTTRKYGGTGLGLTITQSFIHMMGGHIHVESETGEGTTFTIQLPQTVADRSPADTAERGPAHAPLTSTHGNSDGTSAPPHSMGSLEASSYLGTILIIDNSPQAYEELWAILISQGYAVMSAQTGEEGLTMAEQLCPDIIILDMAMADMEGPQVFQSLTQNPRLSEIPVILQTTSPDNNLNYSLGAAEQLSKPINPGQLLATLEKYRPQQPQHKWILVVEDDQDSFNICDKMLKRQGWHVQLATNGHEALAIIEQAISLPSLILLDLMMPEMDGLEFIQKLRQEEAWQLIPVIVLTAKDLANPDRKILSERSQAIYFKSSFEREQLLDEINEFIALSASAIQEGVR